MRMWHLLEDPCPFLFPNDFPTQKLRKIDAEDQSSLDRESSGSNGWFQFPFLVEWMCPFGFTDKIFHRKHIIVCVFCVCFWGVDVFFHRVIQEYLKQNAGIVFWSPEAIACWSFRMYRTHAYRDVRVFFCIRICHMFACTYILCKYTLGCSFSH